ncbi:MAG: hypothetical protein KJ850_09050 [Gammaproteobacteria bacterium]|nr:hypothetical protein [Gammaproteobacteria bacterium]MBU1625181.1 hypothetical protein [Gammaproteobacteria bacterium]MBU1981441.1 hypothetical protein [Gammaproteobacteria bacterium]
MAQSSGVSGHNRASTRKYCESDHYDFHFDHQSCMTMYKRDDSPLSWDIKLNFNLDDLEGKKEKPPEPPKIPPRQLLAEKFPKILYRIEMLWGSLELHQYLELTLFTDRSNREGFPYDVMQALGEVHIEHVKILKQKKVINEDVWDINIEKRK